MEETSIQHVLIEAEIVTIKGATQINLRPLKSLLWTEEYK